jgi:hypothetical protein
MMHTHKSKSLLLAIALVSTLLCAPRSARAYERMRVGFLLDFVTGVSIPISDGDYKRYADPSFKLGLRIGAVLYISSHFGIAPEAQFDFVPVNSNDNTFQNNNIDAQFYRERGLLGARFIIPFGVGSFYLRAALGVDHIGGSTTAFFGTFRSPSINWSSTGFTFEPGVGLQFNVVRHLVVGFYTGFPIAQHDFGTDNADVNTVLRAYNLNPKFTAVDVDFLAQLGLRL